MSDERPLPTKVAVAVVEHCEKYLVGLRPPEVALGGYSEFPGGKVQAGESPAEAAVRECREETGLVVEVVRLLHALEFPYAHGLLHLHFYLCVPIAAQSFAGASAVTTDAADAFAHFSLLGNFRWVDRATLAALTFPPANDSLLQILLH